MPKQPATLFGLRLREARERAGIPQDKLGVQIGLDEGTASTRISRYETGVHEPGFETAMKLAKALKVPVAYFYCPDSELASLILGWQSLSKADRKRIESMVAGSAS